jgi:hypothetical protein
MWNDPRLDVLIVRFTPDDSCTYCHRKFGDMVSWYGKNRILERQRDHVIPKALGGRVTVPCCSLCNQIKGSLKFDSFSDIQDFCLDHLLKGSSLIIRAAKIIRSRRVHEVEFISMQDINEFRADRVTEVETEIHEDTEINVESKIDKILEAKVLDRDTRTLKEFVLSCTIRVPECL